MNMPTTLTPARCTARTARAAHNDDTELWTRAEVEAMLAAKRAAADPGREALADQADAIDLRRLERALTVMGCAGPVSQEECAASLGDFVNRLTAAVERFGSNQSHPQR